MHVSISKYNPFYIFTERREGCVGGAGGEKGRKNIIKLESPIN